MNINLEQYGIKTVDTSYMNGKIAALYLLIEGNQVAIIETGTKYSIPYIKKSLAKNNLDFSNVCYIIPTHVHLDHAAGAGELMRLCPDAKLIIHPSGARHMVNPNKLVQGAIAVYGEENFNRLYGEVIPIVENRIIQAGDGFTTDLNGRILKFIDTPGHARHHFCIWDKHSKAMFTGDTFGVSYREFDNKDEIFIFPTTTPIQFDPEALLSSIDKIMDYNPEYICLTHFAIIKPTDKIVQQLKEGVIYFSDIAINNAKQDNSYPIIENMMLAYLIEQLSKINFTNEDFIKQKLATDINLNTQGLIYWQTQAN